MSIKEKTFIFDPAIFIHEPYIKCPKCDAVKFGVLSVGEQHYSRRCASCFYPKGNEAPVSFPLPKLTKRIIYLDQNAISNMMLSLNTKTKANQARRVQSFWKPLFEKLDRLCKLQLILCPDSDAHSVESELSAYSAHLKRMYELLSHGTSFRHYEEIQRFQIDAQFRKWLGAKRQFDLNVRDFVHGNLDGWQERLIISVNSNPDLSNIQLRRKNRGQLSASLSRLAEEWQKTKGKTFKSWFEDELRGFGSGLLQTMFIHNERLNKAMAGEVPADVLQLLPPMATILVHELFQIMKEEGIEGMEAWKKLLQFFGSQLFYETPSVRITALMYAAMARRVSLGRKPIIGNGFVSDIKVISAFMPYCDAMFIDHECLTLLSERPAADFNPFTTKLFSVKRIAEFMQYLNDIEQRMSLAHLKQVEEVYGEKWGSPYIELYERE